MFTSPLFVYWMGGSALVISVIAVSLYPGAMRRHSGVVSESLDLYSEVVPSLQKDAAKEMGQGLSG